MTRTSIRRFMLATAAAVLTGSCADSPTAPDRPEPGLMLVRLTTPHADDGAAVFRLVLPEGMTTGVPELAVQGLEVFHRRTADTLRVAVFGAIRSGDVMRIAVPDLRQASRVTANIVEVAGEDDALRESLAGYALTVTRP